MLQVAEQQVEGDGRTGVAQVGVAIDGGAADVHAHTTLYQRTKKFLGPRKRIINKKPLSNSPRGGEDFISSCFHISLNYLYFR